MSCITKNNWVKIIIKAAEADIRKLLGPDAKVSLVLLGDLPKAKNEIAGMLHVVANELGMKVEDFGANNRQRRYVELRQIGAWFLKVHFPGITLKELGQSLGYNDHTMALYQIKVANNRLAVGDEPFCKKFNKVKKAIELWETT